MPGNAEDLLKYCIDCNINAIELMGAAAEDYAGAPKRAADQSGTDFVPKMADWRAGVAMDKFKKLRKMDKAF